MARLKENPKRRIKRYTEQQGECWVWTGARGGKGDPIFSYKGKTVLAHRAAWKIFKGEEPPPIILRQCENGDCINPDHLIGEVNEGD